jgi:coproporphyrinogen III oxidase
MTDTFISQKIDASAWFRSLRDDIVTRFEALEQQHVTDVPAGQFEVIETKRTSEDGSDGGGGWLRLLLAQHILVWDML